MKSAGLSGPVRTLSGVGVLVFAILLLLYLLSATRGGEHPLTLESELELCSLLGDELWAQLQYPASDAVARKPETARDALVCALELDPVDADDRWARVARGEDAGQVRTIATVTLMTTATLRQHNPSAASDSYTETFDQELVASGWSGEGLDGPWRWGSLYTMREQVATLVEDDGVVLWTVATGVQANDLAGFTRSAAIRLRNPTP